MDGTNVLYVHPDSNTKIEALAFNINNVYANGSVVINGMDLTGSITDLDVGSLTITYEQEDDVNLGILTLLVK